jgi:hypothetical protein
MEESRAINYIKDPVESSYTIRELTTTLLGYKKDTKGLHTPYYCNECPRSDQGSFILDFNIFNIHVKSICITYTFNSHMIKHFSTAIFSDFFLFLQTRQYEARDRHKNFFFFALYNIFVSS